MSKMYFASYSLTMGFCQPTSGPVIAASQSKKFSSVTGPAAIPSGGFWIVCIEEYIAQIISPTAKCIQGCQVIDLMEYWMLEFQPPCLLSVLSWPAESIGFSPTDRTSILLRSAGLSCSFSGDHLTWDICLYSAINLLRAEPAILIQFPTLKGSETAGSAFSTGRCWKSS